MDNKIFTNIDNIKNVAKRLNYQVFESNVRNFNLNIWCIRSKYRTSGNFDDLMVMFYKDLSNKWQFNTFVITTDPSDISLIQSLNKLGTAIVYNGQYPKAWKLGLHKGVYEALVQRGNLTVIRDFNKDIILDIPSTDTLKIWGKLPDCKVEIKRTNNRYIENYLINGKIKYTLETGNDFGINCHRASAWKILQKVGLYSQGCIVHQNPYRYNNEFIPMIKESVKLWGNDFTLTLVHEEEFYH